MKGQSVLGLHDYVHPSVSAATAVAARWACLSNTDQMSGSLADCSRAGVGRHLWQSALRATYAPSPRPGVCAFSSSSLNLRLQRPHCVLTPRVLCLSWSGNGTPLFLAHSRSAWRISSGSDASPSFVLRVASASPSAGLMRTSRALTNRLAFGSGGPNSASAVAGGAVFRGIRVIALKISQLWSPGFPAFPQRHPLPDS